MRPRRLFGILERALLGAGMGAVLSIAEWRLSQSKARRRKEQTSDGRSDDAERPAR
jgi:hypothetical protein